MNKRIVTLCIAALVALGAVIWMVRERREKTAERIFHRRDAEVAEKTTTQQPLTLMPFDNS
jgi:hypothetical protein